MNTVKLSSENETSKDILDTVRGCCSSSDKINKAYLLNYNDCVFENGVMVRMKRKYGMFKRVVYVVEYNNS